MSRPGHGEDGRRTAPTPTPSRGSRAAGALTALLLGLGLTACSEKPQTQGQRKVGQPSHVGTGTPYQAPGWKAGDATSWNDHLRNRAQYGQNDYARTSGK